MVAQLGLQEACQSNSRTCPCLSMPEMPGVPWHHPLKAAVLSGVETSGGLGGEGALLAQERGPASPQPMAPFPCASPPSSQALSYLSRLCRPRAPGGSWLSNGHRNLGTCLALLGVQPPDEAFSQL